jgi:multiple sugar transport system permease protein
VAAATPAPLQGSSGARDMANTVSVAQAAGWHQYNPAMWIGELSETRYWMYLLLPSLILIAAVVLYPMVYGFQLSVREMRLSRPDLGTGFVGLKHYARM